MYQFPHNFLSEKIQTILKKYLSRWIFLRIWYRTFCLFEYFKYFVHFFVCVPKYCYSVCEELQVYLHRFTTAKTSGTVLDMIWIYSMLTSWKLYLALNSKGPYIQDLERVKAVSQFLERFPDEKRLSKMSLEIEVWRQHNSSWYNLKFYEKAIRNASSLFLEIVNSA